MMHGQKNIRLVPESSGIDSIKISTVYVHSDAKDLFWNSFLLHECIASSFSGVSETVQESTFWNDEELICHDRLNGLHVRIAMDFQCSFQSWE